MPACGSSGCFLWRFVSIKVVMQQQAPALRPFCYGHEQP